MAIVSALQSKGLFVYASKGFTLRCRIKILRQPFMSILLNVIPAEAGIQDSCENRYFLCTWYLKSDWIPAFAGMTIKKTR
jgi:hypothetical protein